MAETKAKAKKALGRGLGAFFDNVSEENPMKISDKTGNEDSGVMKIKLRDIEPNPEQPRRKFEKEKLEALA